MSMNFFELETIVLLLTLMMAYRMNALGMRHDLYTSGSTLTFKESGARRWRQ